MRPGKVEFRNCWSQVREIYLELTGYMRPDEMPPKERRILDGAYLGTGGRPFIFELGEKLHFNAYSAPTLGLYPANLVVGFPIGRWIKQCNRKSKLEGGGFARPSAPLFPGENGRRRQQAFRDALTDILPLEFEFLPMLRLGDFEKRDWFFQSDAHDRIEALIEFRCSLWAY